jgi:hypothetical protein
MDVASAAITSAGTGYTGTPTITFSPTPCTVNGTTCIRATGTVTASPRQTFAAQRSIDTVTVTIGGKAPTHVSATQTIQSAIDKAHPGDLIIVDPACSTVATATNPAVPTACSSSALSGTTPTQVASEAAHNELLIMWKPVRLQGVGAASSVIDATTHPAGQTKMGAWRQQINCLFGLALNGSPILKAPAFGQPVNPYDPTGQVSCPGTGWADYTPDAFGIQVDRLPLEATVGWDANLNGNLAEQLQEPSLMGALEGAGVTVLAKGVSFPSSPYDPTLLAGFPTGTTLLQETMSSPGGAQCLDGTGQHNPFPSNFSCNPSSIDGVTITQSSQGGGGIFVHGWGHNLQIANNRIYSNAGTLAGGINLGQGEFAPAYIQGDATTAVPPGSCEESPVPGAVLPYCENVNVNIHNNYVSLNSSTGDELFSATPAGAGGVNICTGSDYYKFNYNWVCGNLSTGDGGGLAHTGFSYNGDIEHNTIIFNQSTNPTIQSNGGGLLVMGTPDADIVCNNLATLDADCAPPSGSTGGVPNIVVAGIGPSDGVGPGLVVNGNLIMGNAAESGTGGGIAFNAVNGSDMVAFPDDPGQWNAVTVTNNIIVDNVAGWDGAGISLFDSPNVNIINNTIANNASTASSGILFNTLGAPLASQPGTSTTHSATTTAPQVAGVVALQHSAVLFANLAATPVVCPAGHFSGTGTNAATNGACRRVSYPKLENNVIYHNASYQIGVGALSTQFQQNIVTLRNASFTAGGIGAAPPSQTTTGQCVAASFWDIGVRGDTGPANHSSGFTLNPSDSVLSSGTGYTGPGNTFTGNPNFVTSYCDGARTPPETPGPAAKGWQVPPGISDATVPNPIFNLTPAATVDEGNNWVNLAFGPLSMSNPTAIAGPNGNYGGGLPLGNYSITTGSAAAGRVTGANFTDAPEYDFFDNPRKPGGSTDAGAVRLGGTTNHSEFTVSPSVVDFGFVPHGAPTTVDQDIVVTNSDIVALSGISFNFNCAGVTNCNLPSFAIQPQYDTCTNATLAAGASCVITVVFNPTSSSQAARNANLVVTAGGLSQTVALTGHDSIATVRVVPGTGTCPGATNAAGTACAPATATTPPMVATPANTVAVTGNIYVTNTSTRCDAAVYSAAVCPRTGMPAAYPNPSVDAGPFIPTAITLTPVTGTGTWALGGTCAVGTAINPGLAAIPANAADGTPASPYVPSGNCTVTATYTPPAACTTTPTAANCNGSARITMQGYGTAGAAQPATIINRVINAN